MWKLGVIAYCPKIQDQGFFCMACHFRPATGHVQVNGGIADGRIILIVCEHCSSPEDNCGTIKQALVDQAVARHINLITGEVGTAGPPDIRHHDHWDPLEDHEHQETP